MENIARIGIEKGDELLPTIMTIAFTPMPWKFAFRQGRMERWVGSETEIQTLEVRHAIQSCVYMIERELIRAAEKQLGIKF